MDTEATRPRARIGFMRRWGSASRAAVQLDPSQAIGPADAAASTPLAEALRDHATMLRRRHTPARPQRLAALPSADVVEPVEEFEAPIIPESLMQREPLPADGWLKRLFAASRIARYRRQRRTQQVGRHQDLSV
jgi:hypothetical protein